MITDFHCILQHRWGSTKCPNDTTMLYKSFVAASYNDRKNHHDEKTSPHNSKYRGGGANHLCMHPSPEHPEGNTGSFNEGGALLTGVEYHKTGHPLPHPCLLPLHTCFPLHFSLPLRTYRCIPLSASAPTLTLSPPPSSKPDGQKQPSA